MVANVAKEGPKFCCSSQPPCEIIELVSKFQNHSESSLRPYFTISSANFTPGIGFGTSFEHHTKSYLVKFLHINLPILEIDLYVIEIAYG